MYFSLSSRNEYVKANGGTEGGVKTIEERLGENCGVSFGPL